MGNHGSNHHVTAPSNVNGSRPTLRFAVTFNLPSLIYSPFNYDKYDAVLGGRAGWLLPLGAIFTV